MLVLRPGALGDTLLAVPALRALRRRNPLTLYAHGPCARLLRDLDEVDHGFAFDDASLEWVFRGTPPPEPTVAWMAHPVRDALVWAPSRPAGEQHVAAYLFETLAALGIHGTLDERPLHVVPTPTEEVLVHVGSGSRAKNWPAACFADTIRRLDNARLIVGEADVYAVREVEQHLGHALPHLEVDLPELASRLAGCRAYVGNDSGVSHLAGLCGARTVALFGPTSPTVWRPLGPRVTTLPFDATPREVASAALA